MISVAEALDALFALAAPLGTEDVALKDAAGRVLAESAVTDLTQPPFAASSMDGFAIPTTQVAPGQNYTVIGEAAAGHRFGGALGPGQAVRIFTGAPVPEGALRVIIQEDVIRTGNAITLKDNLDPQNYIRPAGMDFAAGHALTAPRLLTAQDIALAAAMNIPRLTVTRKPDVALIATGDELVSPGDAPGPDQIVASNTYGIHALLRQIGAHPRLLPIARDTEYSLSATLDLAAGADLIVTVGGASVGDHDLVGQVAAARGLERSFYKVAMRPGKPLMAGRLGGAMMLGLPGNPVSALVCGHVFLAPVIRRMLGLPAAPAPRERAPLASPLPANSLREHYMRARLTPDGLQADKGQDSVLLSRLAAADALLVRAPGAPAAEAGEIAEFIRL